MIESDERYTPAEVFDPLNFVFGAMGDPCPRDWKRDGLTIEWPEKCFVNPPYSEVYEWAGKAVVEAKMNGKFVAFLIPNDCSTRAFQLLRAEAWGRWEIPFRVKFETPSGKRVDVARSHVCFFLGGLRMMK